MMARKKDFLESIDQYIALAIIGVVVLYLMISFREVLWLLAGAITFLVGIFALNKGKKTTVNLRTDVTYIGLAVVVMVGAIVATVTTGNLMLLLIVLLLGLVIAELYR